ncbi:hypothetical protein CBB2_3444 [Clostridium botulinum]|uniref:hypothetical protein n=1 Tax=Clostridium botulinum TaxID=1491 RepID=UPI0005B7640C|nr:hypothetical protein [Clostridium botulinum]NFD29452.1 hypothetical protein [Clostridium botulinum]NFD34337.1 hypothetical protein [Clostridium botulinum]NFD58643.1 hypothetical protein [Clostridium botulinum]NFE00433.1 hypothetical protein [Clostridium botulinum]BAQ36447.1 hypothetical protein CBB2_3444 [Clostridium botulinum]
MMTDIIEIYTKRLVDKEATKIVNTNDVLATTKSALQESNIIKNTVLRSDNGVGFTFAKFM